MPDDESDEWLALTVGLRDAMCDGVGRWNL